MPNEKMTVSLNLVNFFTGNPGLDVAPSTQEKKKSVLFTKVKRLLLGGVVIGINLVMYMYIATGFESHDYAALMRSLVYIAFSRCVAFCRFLQDWRLLGI